MKKLTLAYFGSSDFAANFLEKILLDKSISVEVKLVVTQPDQKVGRKQIITETPVSNIAKNNNIECLKIENLKFNENCKLKIENSDLCLVYAFGELIPKEILNLPKYGFWNIHPSLLPKYRGPSPIATPLINGDETTGVAIIKMDEEIDHGPIIAQQSLTIKKTDKRPDLEKKLTDLGFSMFKKIVAGERTKFFATWDPLKGEGSHGDKKFRSEPFKEQNHKEAIYTKKLTKQDGFIDLKTLKKTLEGIGSEKIFNLFRGLYFWPGIWTVLPNGKRLKITNMTMKPFDETQGKQFNNLTIESVQLEGKKEVDFETFNKAYKIF